MDPSFHRNGQSPLGISEPASTNPTSNISRSGLGVPAHIHHVAYRMANPPVERPNSRREFQHLLQALDISEGAIDERFGYGFKVAPNGDRLVVVWEAHTEYYSYQVWHVRERRDEPVRFWPHHVP